MALFPVLKEVQLNRAFLRKIQSNESQSGTAERFSPDVACLLGLSEVGGGKGAIAPPDCVRSVKPI